MSNFGGPEVKGCGRELLFEEDDFDLFRVDDIDLKRKAVAGSIMPRLVDIVRNAAVKIQEVYGIDPLSDSYVSMVPRAKTPHHGTKEFRKDLTFAFACFAPPLPEGGIKGGFGLEPVSLGVVMTSRFIRIEFNVSKGKLGLKTSKAVGRFFADHELEVLRLVASTEGCLIFWDSKRRLCELSPYPIEANLKTFEQGLWQVKIGGCHFHKGKIRFGEVLEGLLVILFPVYYALRKLLRGEEYDFSEMVRRAIAFSSKLSNEMSKKQHDVVKADSIQVDQVDLLDKIERSVPVMPGLRWQVFQRDDWRCVSCGKTVDEGARLEVDHIIPRSKGGKDELSNFQTLCRECNIGKSNRNQVDLRKHHSLKIQK